MTSGPFDRFTERARTVISLAREEAQRFNHNYVGPEHLLLGLVRQGDGVAAKVLSNLGVELPKVRSTVEFIIGRGEVARETGMTPRFKKVIELAVDEARRLRHHYIGTEHLLLGLIREGDGIAAGVLDSLGVDLEQGRTEVVKVLRQAESPFRTGPRREPTTRIGVGYDVHRLGEGRPLHLGGVSIPYHLGLVGHSDADVLVHAVMDALLGAAGLHDIGHYFPNDDPHWKGASSIDMLTTVMCELRRSRFEVENVDSTIIAEEPKLAPYIPEMRRRIATALGTNPSCVGVKATTAEGTGPEGRGESIAVHSVALIRQR